MVSSGARQGQKLLGFDALEHRLAARKHDLPEGRDALIQISANGGSTFATVAGVRTNGATINNEPVDITNAGSEGYRELLPDGGVQSMSMSVDGIVVDDTAFEDMIDQANDRTLVYYRFQFGAGAEAKALFAISSFQITGTYNDARTFLGPDGVEWRRGDHAAGLTHPLFPVRETARAVGRRCTGVPPPAFPSKDQPHMANKFRKEVTVELDGISLTCRPTLAKIGDIESRFGPAIEVLRKLGSGTIAVTEMTSMVGIIIKGVAGAPAPKDVPELVFAAGAYSFAGVVSELIANAISSDEPPAEEAQGNTA